MNPATPVAHRRERPRGRQFRFRYGVFRALLLVAILTLPALLDPISREAALHPREAAASPVRINRLPAQGERHQAAPPSPSGAYPPYPLNHTLDADPLALGGPTNADFETAGYAVGTEPSNAGLDTAPYPVGSQPTNNDFATGDFTGWTTAGSGVSLQTTGGPDNDWARLTGSGAAITSSAFTIDAAAQVVWFDLGSLTTSGSASVTVSALSGSGYSTSTTLRSFSCTACNSWAEQTAPLQAFLGQSIKLKFTRTAGTPGQLGWAGEMQDSATSQVYLRAREYSPGSGRFTSRDSLIPNAPGTQGYNPYAYASDNPVTLTDPTGMSAIPMPCGICTPLLPGVAAEFVAAGAALAATAAVDLASWANRNKWVISAFALVAAFFVCVLLPACHEGIGSVTGRANDRIEREKEKFRRRLVTTGILVTWIIAVGTAIDVPHGPCEIDQPYSASNFRKNLACLTTGWYIGPIGFEAHHVFPQKFQRFFDAVLGPNGNHNPIYGQWWIIVFHQALAGRYNRLWERFIVQHQPPGPQLFGETLEQGRLIMAMFDMTVLY